MVYNGNFTVSFMIVVASILHLLIKWKVYLLFIGAELKQKTAKVFIRKQHNIIIQRISR